MEYDTSKPFENGKVPSKPKSNLNFGINFHPYEWLTLGAGYKRGEEFRFSFAFKGNFYEGISFFRLNR